MTNKTRNYSLQTITKTFPTRLKHVRLKHAIITDNAKISPEEKRKGLNQEQIAQIDAENLERSLRKTQSELQDLIECNTFEWFGTFTFDPKKIDRYNPEEVKKAMSKWLNNARRKSPDMTYILVPERHKDGAIHFHALLGNYAGKMADSGSQWQKQPIFNVIDYKLGFTNFTKIRSKSKTANYCRKYITKDMIFSEKNRRRYWRSKNLKTPPKIYNQTAEELILQNISKINLAEVTHFENDHVEATSFPLKEEKTPPHDLDK